MSLHALISHCLGDRDPLVLARSQAERWQPWLQPVSSHSPATGDAEQNLQLSYARASAVRDWMQRMGDLPDNCFAVQGAAGKQPIASNDTASGRAANRRVDIRLMPQAQACALSETGEG
jgi:type VI secretion system protein VasL